MLGLSVATAAIDWASQFGGWANLTPSGLLIIVVMMILLGLLIPRFVYLRKEEEVKYLRAANERLRDIADAAVKSMETVNGTLLSIQTVLNTTLHPPGERVGGDRSADVD